MANESRVEELSREELIALVLELRRQVELLREEIARLKRSGRRQAAPFSKEKPVPNPKKAGRKKGQGPFGRRTAPAGEPKTKVDAEPPPCCPFCGGPLEEDDVEFATTTDVPEQPQPEVTEYRVSVCHCRDCGKKVRGTAPGLAADQYGATAHRVGPSVMAAAHALHYGVGVPQRKVPGVLKELTGVKITQSALAQDALRRAAREVGAKYQQLREGVRRAPFVHTDDTGWRVGGKTAFLMGFETDRAAVYQIRSQHRNQEVREIIPSDYGGVMITDRGKSYDAGEFDAVEQQKCLGHILRNITEVLETKQGRAREFGVYAKLLLQDGMELWRARDSLAPEVFAGKADELKEMLGYHLRARVLKDRDNQRLLNGLGQQDDCGRLLRCLSAPFVEPTNNRAAFAAFTSLAQTALKNGNTSVTSAFRLLFSASKISSVETLPEGR
ncbi:MAG: transposase [Acidobacteria bacterium]|nr:transposase [Acidobacteriota bacterium]